MSNGPGAVIIDDKTDNSQCKNRRTYHWYLAGAILCWLLFWLFITIPFAIYFTYKAIVAHYFASDEFFEIKKSIAKNTRDCNELNEHIEALKRTYTDYGHENQGTANYQDNSVWNYKRPNLRNEIVSNKVYRCSLTVCRNAAQQPFKYVCKYFNIKPDEETLEKFETTLNNYLAAEQGKELLKNERDKILEGITDQLPWYKFIIRQDELLEQLGFTMIDFSQLYFPKYTFQYISGGGNSSMRCDVVFDTKNLADFVQYLSELIKFRKSVAGQRALMTPSLREHIKERDHYTCRHCKNSVKAEPNLLLEIDHIVPLSKGGFTTEKNLQTLCWRCNRSKGAKLESEVRPKAA